MSKRKDNSPRFCTFGFSDETERQRMLELVRNIPGYDAGSDTITTCIGDYSVRWRADVALSRSRAGGMVIRLCPTKCAPEDA